MTTAIKIHNFQWAAEPGYVFKSDNGQWLTVLSSKAWWCDEPLSFGKFDGEDGYLYDLTCRPATDEEITKAEADQKALREKQSAERAEKIAKAQAEQSRYESELNALVAERDALINEYGLKEIRDVPSIQGEITENSVTPPGRGFSFTRFLRVTRDTAGNVILVSWWNEAAGGIYWGTPELAKRGERVQRISQWWREGAYHAKDYPGPGIPREELDANELAEVERLEALKYEACVKQQRLHVWNLEQRRAIEPVATKIEGNQMIVEVEKNQEPLFRAELDKQNRLLADESSSWASTYADPKRGTYKEMAPLQFVIRIVK